MIQNKKALKDAGIKLTNPQTGSILQRYIALQDQIEALSEAKRKEFEEMIKEHVKMQNDEYRKI